METKQDLDDSCQASEECNDEVINTPKCNIFNQYGINAKELAKDLFGLIRTYELPYKNYYIVMTPYGERKGMTINEVVKIVKRWGCHRTMITRETMSKLGKPVNPHYNIIITTTRELSTYNKGHLNVDVQELPRLKDIEQAIDYSFKEYIKPLKKCTDGVHYYAWRKI